MKQEDIERMFRSFRKHNNCISRDADAYIKRNYTKIAAERTKGQWYKVYPEHSDSKYGAYMVNPDLLAYREPTMLEFYGGAVVD